MPSLRFFLAFIHAAALAAALSMLPACGGGGSPLASGTDAIVAGGNAPQQDQPYQFVRHADPMRTVVNDAAGNWRATFTDGAYTVRHAGATRTFAEPVQGGVTGGTQTVTHTSWVHVMPAPWPTGGIPTAAQVDAVLARTDPDVLEIAMQYVWGAPVVKVADASAYSGFRWISGGTDYGPAIGADFQDHLGIDWNYGASFGGVDTHKTSDYGLLDCSGFIRMVYGYRLGMPLAKLGSERPGVAIPRTAALQEIVKGVGAVIVRNTGVKPASWANLSPGDVVFFDSDNNDGVIDHVGIYLGLDNEGQDRVLSSRLSLLGPTMKDPASSGGASTLNGNGWMGAGLRSARRY